MYETWLYAAGSPVFAPAAHGSAWLPMFQHPAGVATARFLRTLQQDGVISANAVTLPWPQTYTQFTDGQAGMVIAANNIIPGIQHAGLGGKVEVLPMPRPPKPFGTPTALGGGEVYFINSHAPNKQGALDLLHWMLTKQFQVNEVTGGWAKGSAAAGAASEMSDLTNVNAAALRGNNPLDLGFQKILEGPVRQEPAISNWTALKTDISQSLVNIMVNHAKASSTLAALAKQLLPLAK
jgi:ABC-type glycerol-3-phosphate transport system substrate-binding protein